jgi:hypothetical protein
VSGIDPGGKRSKGRVFGHRSILSQCAVTVKEDRGPTWLGLPGTRPEGVLSRMASALALGSLLAVLLAAAIGTSFQEAHAGFITQADFQNPIIYDLENLPFAYPATLSAPVTVGPFTFTSDDGFIRYANLFPGAGSRGIGRQHRLRVSQYRRIPGVQKFGFSIFAGGDAEPFVANVSFFGTGGLLGSTVVSRPGGPPAFVGFETPTGLIAEMRR